MDEFVDYNFPEKMISKISKKEIRTLIMIFILTNGNKYSQTEIKDIYNNFYEETPSLEPPFSYDNIRKWIMPKMHSLVPDVTCKEDMIIDFMMDIEWLTRQLQHIGPINDVGVSRISKVLDEWKIIERIPTKDGQGAYPLLNYLKKDYFSLEMLLSKLYEFKWPKKGQFVRFSHIIILSEYGRNLINNTFIEDIGRIRGVNFNDNEKNQILTILRSSPSALMGQLYDYRLVSSPNWIIEDCRDEKYIKKDVFQDLIIDLGRDVRYLLFESPFEYKVSVNWEKYQNLDIYIGKNDIEASF